MKFTSSLLFLFGGLASTAVLHKRTSSTTDSFHLYAYGTGIGGLPVFYSDGKLSIALPSISFTQLIEQTGNAFIGNTVPEGSKVNANITCKNFHHPQAHSFSN